MDVSTAYIERWLSFSYVDHGGMIRRKLKIKQRVRPLETPYYARS